eukprot:gnl/TRDRNA2_/TRDRNA2_165415_c0_seq1.p1 gnl/TRDRNA2_/TRDRNA2_165415_c0~~gnl/TRDRNA2_/TRDRNA2_165415_c0_seq1.p1  ORF type:complete len:646 (-),score=112.00 gnl/TRDRNA2_/TRDRNA2_165415_c0_seq1:259-2196(-)
MAGKYIPPNMRAQMSKANEDQKAAETSGGYSRDERPRQENGRREDRDRPRETAERWRDDRDEPRRGNDRSDRGQERSNEKVQSSREGGGDWHKRQDGRRGNREELSELEVFGEAGSRSTAGIDFDKYDKIPVQVTGNGADEVKPISRFSEARLVDSLFENLRRCGYDRPTPVQKYAIPIVAKGRDLMACAQTGSGKTCAFMVPCLESLLRSGPPAPKGNSRRPKPMPCGLVLAPTRELAAQIHVECIKFAYDTGIRCCLVYGGADMREQRGELERGCDVLVATPGRLTDMCDRGNVSLQLVQFFILDEADRMLDMGFEPQVRQIVEHTDMGTSAQCRRQSMMFSATFAREVQIMARDFLTDYMFITVGRVGSASELVSQKVIYTEDYEQKKRALEKVLKDYLNKDGLAVIFVETKRGADSLEMDLHEKERALEKVLKDYLNKDGLAVIFVETKRGADSLEMDLHEKGVSVTAIHGDRSQPEREEALSAFKSGANPVLVATDVAARGLDIPNVNLVVNFDLPKQLDDYVHRIGRTGRAGRNGVAVAFVNQKCMYLNELYDLLSEAKQEIPIWYEELCRSSRRGPDRFSKGKSNFGGSDIRNADEIASSKVERPGEARSTGPPKATMSSQPVRGANAFGNTGLDDAW